MKTLIILSILLASAQSFAEFRPDTIDDSLSFKVEFESGESSDDGRGIATNIKEESPEVEEDGAESESSPKYWDYKPEEEKF